MAFIKNQKKTCYSLSRLIRFGVSGFTLLELLISMIVAGIVVSGLLYIVVELLQIDRRESVLNQTQRDMQRALDYISDDLREAVYIYDTPSIVADQLSDSPVGGIPVLAFWRPDPIESIPDCTVPPISTSDDLVAECNTLEVRQSAYSLVVYFQKKKDDNANWSGNSRIIRYELDKYSNLDILAETTGYSDPASLRFDFDGWTISGTVTDGTNSVLVDFVDDPDKDFNQSPLSDSCNSIGTDYTIVPSTATTTDNTSFFGCIKDDSPGTGIDGSSNQDAYLFLRGSIDGAGGAVNSFSDDSALPILETRVLMRGVLNKNPAN